MKKKKEVSNITKMIYAIIIGFAVISFWRGIWGLWTIYVFPENLVLSLWISTITGLIILFFTHHLIKELM